MEIVLLSDESEAELELVDEAGLNIDDKSKRPKQSPSDFTNIHIPTLQLSNPPAPRIYDFGCKWDPVDYSCSYDCIFMAFAWMYFHATKHWRETWTGKSRASKTLSHHLSIILQSIEGPAGDQLAARTPVLFSRGRDAFRDTLSEENPTTFKRHGPVNACLTDILTSLSHGETSSKYYSFISSCGGPGCNIRLITPSGAPYMLTRKTWTSITHSENPPHQESLQEWVVRWLDSKVSSLPNSCAGCLKNCTQTHSFLWPPWIWFEVFVEQPHVILPSFQLSFSSHNYRLAAVIYGNGCHFVARLSTPLGTWWHYDGQVNSGRPTTVSITCGGDLVACGERYTMTALVYCLSC